MDRDPAQRDFRRYLQAVERFPLLDREEELALAGRSRAGDAEAAQALVESQLRSVVRVARSYAGAVALQDLVAEGNLGLLEAVRRFEPERGLRFFTYARYWVRAFILARLRVQRAAPSVSLDVPLAGEEGTTTRLDYLRAEGPSQEEVAAAREEHALVARALAELWPSLDERERTLVERRLLASDGGESLARVGNRFGLTRERLRQIEVGLKDKLRASYRALGA